MVKILKIQKKIGNFTAPAFSLLQKAIRRSRDFQLYCFILSLLKLCNLEIFKFATNFQEICNKCSRNFQEICKKCATNFQEICNKYSKNLQIFKKFAKNFQKFARNFQ
mgnify:CR=1 FL=1